MKFLLRHLYIIIAIMYFIPVVLFLGSGYIWIISYIASALFVGFAYLSDSMRWEEILQDDIDEEMIKMLVVSNENLFKVIKYAEEVLGKDNVESWMTEPLLALGYKVPVEVCKTEEGTKQLLQILGQIEHGCYI